MKQQRFIIFFTAMGCLILGLFNSCGKKDGTTTTVTTKDSAKTVNISVDETFQPLVKQEVEMFHFAYPKEEVKAFYKPEKEAIQDLLSGKSSVVILARPSTSAEKAKLKYPGNLRIHETVVGYDAIALVINKDNPIKRLSMENLKAMLMGKIKNWKDLGGEDKEIVIVFDNPASGTVRFITDSLTAGSPLPPNVYSARTNPDVIKYVGENVQAIGFIGQSWVSDKDSPEVQAYLEKVDRVALKAEGKPDQTDQYFQPFQTEIKLGQYPLSRKIYCLNRESSHGTGTDFVYYFASDPGQRILLKAGMIPEIMPSRPIIFKEEKL